jgi:hypothetical protein
MKTFVSYPEVESLVTAPEIDSSVWECVSGKANKEYFSKSPWATITSYARGFVVTNIVTGGKHPVSTWDKATSLRSQLASRYQTISTRAGW